MAPSAIYRAAIRPVVGDDLLQLTGCLQHDERLLVDEFVEAFAQCAQQARDVVRQRQCAR
ncbi:hypothetical protein ACH4ZU_26205 [Streptomyces sp. NPDC020472]|uniref:hypothetical protein n=1 Tax=Streptomyces sp. NPDC020472 TaxID=3365075 RepID=UPI0037B9E63F